MSASQNELRMMLAKFACIKIGPGKSHDAVSEWVGRMLDYCEEARILLEDKKEA